ncbi:hypothetical protein LTR56_021152 [Elasticomyces elasticus]|nr:hypothetical protein LTR56_021152 [Elasticomyces elasticus]KAK3631827.1 hypothetical protein LTR22_020895 [Elasticomyces elasticus]KAK4909683.1 hypothetical protein LTR49_021577 [Elasticomyces elasticus]KAK5749545.1 hypothetical protein LTS12_020411 [Elasticomyces elasticus]
MADRLTIDLRVGLRELYPQGLYSDLLIYSGDSHYEVHKIILHAQSSVFGSMFEGELHLESTGQHSIRLDEDDPIALGVLIDFLYTSLYNEKRAALAGDALLFAVDLYAMAVKYKVDALCFVAANRLTQSLTVTMANLQACIRVIRKIDACSADDDDGLWNALARKLTPQLRWLGTNSDFWALQRELKPLMTAMSRAGSMSWSGGEGGAGK